LPSDFGRKTPFGSRLCYRRARLGLDPLDFAALFWESDEPELQTICRNSIDDWEKGLHLPVPKRAEALARFLKDPVLLQLYYEERRSPRSYHWRVESGVITPEEAETIKQKTAKKISDTKTGQPMSETSRQHMSDGHIGKPLSEAHCKAISDGQRGRIVSEYQRQRISEANSIQDEFTGLGDKNWRYQQREKRDNPPKPRGRPGIQDEFTGKGTASWRYEQREKKRALEARRKEARLRKVA
jgi:hypothetical protein